MKNVMKMSGIITLALALVFSIAACVNPTDPVHTHDWGTWTQTKEPTCTTAGIEIRICSFDASHTETRTVPISPNAHNWGEWNITKAATQTQEGEETRICKLDSSHKETNQLTANPVSVSPISIQSEIDNIKIQQNSDLKFYSAIYDNDLGCIVLTYKVGVIKNMFLQYLSKVVVAGPGRKFTYTEISGHSESIQTENINMIIANVSGSVYYAVAGASATAAAAAITSVGLVAKASAYASAGKLSFDLTSVSTTRYTETYTEYFWKGNSLEQDLSLYPAGKKYAVAAFADVGVYQLMKYNPDEKTAMAIEGKSLYFNVEAEPFWDVYEYLAEEELSIEKKLEPLKQVQIEVIESDLYQDLKTFFTETRTYDLDHVSSTSQTSRDETVSPELITDLLKRFGYSKVKIDVSYRFKAETIWGGGLRLQIASAGKTRELGRKDASRNTSWGDGYYSVTVEVESLNSPAGEFMLLWSRTGITQYCVGRRTISITAIK